MKDKTRVLKSALPLYLDGTNGKAVLVQHGYNGYPAEMYSLAMRLHDEGYTVVVPRLPGHGTSVEDFRLTGWKLWLDHVRNEYLNLQSRFESVSVVGLSMGGVLALMMAADFQPEKAILLSPAMVISRKLVHFTPVLRFFIPYIKRDRQPSVSDDEDRTYMEREYWSNHYTAQVASLYKLVKKAKKRLPDVVCPVYIMLSEQDSSVPLYAGDLIEKGVGGPVEKLVLKRSPHVLFEGPEKELVIDKVVEWLRV